MGAMTDLLADVGEHRVKVADGDGEHLQVGRLGSPALNLVPPNGSYGVPLSRKIVTNPMTDARDYQGRLAEGVAGKPYEKRADEWLGMSPARTRIHRGRSEGFPRGTVGGILRGHSGGILRGLSGGIHLPNLQSITFEMTRLPEEDAGVQRLFTEPKEVETPPETSGAGAGSDADAPPGTKSRLRKHLTAVGACSF